MNKGNMNIKNAVQYSTRKRGAITTIILREYKILKDKDPDGTTFALHVLSKLQEANYTAPDGSPLTLRGVRYQVLRSGIGFRGARVVPAPIFVTPKPAPEPEQKREILRSLSKLPELLERIVMSEDVSPAQRAALVEAWFEVKK